MTTIAANKEYMASDSMAADHKAAVKQSVQKFWRVRGWLIGGAGTYEEIVSAIRDITENKEMSPLEVLRQCKLSNFKESELLLLSPSGKLYMFEGTEPFPVQEKHAAIGTGAQGALIAMNMGATPKQAIAEVRKVDPNTGGRIITRKV